MSYKLFLDDERQPQQCYEYMKSRIDDPSVYMWNWIIVKNYSEFTIRIIQHGLPTLISFDHDLASIHYHSATGAQSFKYEEFTGYDCAKWLVEYCELYDKTLPDFIVHSMNPIGTENITSYLNNFKRHQ